ncbi:IF-2B-domain-containing protein [Hesseltinella vesiculosa]|uniref:Translation initiation factor eIF2B subunit delta n=1 Tax=Hesseltinella vesiculosa TaxID=101127 RepID=A0A1X2GVW4_9FUNG|nr:IF-2B-domain-containing protein [Hesseltinella vesiculosa]
MDPSNKATPLTIPGAKGIAGSSGMGQPMSSSYENQWMLGDDKKHERRKSSTVDSNKENKDASSQPNASVQPPARKSQKSMTKAERRALQEQQKLEKERRVAAGLPKNAKKAAELLAKTGGGSSVKSGSPLSVAGTPDNTTASVGKSVTSPDPAAAAKKAAKKSAGATSTAKSQKNQVPWLLHLDASKRPDTMGFKDLHPAVKTLALYFSEYKIVGSNARCVAMLQTFSKVIEEHKPPADATFSRHIQKHLDPHIAYLLATRPMSLSMRECIRWLKKEMADIVEEDPPLSDEDARHRLMNRIEHFIRERITMADQLIVQNGLQKINDGEVILTFGKSSVVESLLLATKKKGINFKVIVVDSRPLFEGKHLLRRLAAAGIDCSYHLLSSVYVALSSVTKVIMGAHALLNNGAVYSRTGTSMVAMAASDKQIPVMICCETYKFVNRTQVDSFVMNEIGNPDDLVNTKPMFNSIHQNHPNPTGSALENWREQPNLRILNLMYDVTPSKFITLVVTEVGLIPCTSAPVIWREYNEEFGKRG